jgi:hypothetical protein
VRFASKVLPLVLLLSLTAAALAQSPTPGLNALPEVEFSRLSQGDPNPLGQKALAVRPEQWKHAETEHFIYHFADTFMATPISIEAEFHYRVVAKELQSEQPAGDTKSRFLAATDKSSFLLLLDALARHQPFETALFQNFGTKFLTVPALEEKFREYATNELGTSLTNL